jgi:hypothetical protein
MAATSNPRSRLWVGVCVVAVIALGLASRNYPSMFPAFLGKYPGDALWTLMVFFGWAFVTPGASTFHLAACALSVSCIVEFTQLYQAPWINALRSTTAGHLVLGSTFSWFDICAYTVGVAIGVCLDVLLVAAVRFAAVKRLSLYVGSPPKARN